MPHAHPFWLMRLSAASGLAPLGLAGGVAALMAVTTLLVAAVASPIEYQRKPYEPFIPYLMAASIVISTAFIQRVVRWADAALLQLRTEATGRQAVALSGRILWVAFAVGCTFSIVFHEINTSRWTRFLAGDWNAFDVWVVLVVLPTVGLVFQTFGVILACARALGRFGTNELRVELFLPDAGRPLARFGLNVLGLSSIVTAAILLLPALYGVAPFGLAIISSVNNLIVCAAGLALCLHGFVRRMRGLQREELARVNRALAGDASALRDSPHASQLAGSSFVELLAYRREVEAARTSPVDTRVLGRALLYTVLPPLSWVAGALVEQGLDRWIF